MQKRFYATVMALTATVVLGASASAADLPKATQKALKDLKLDASLMDGLDAELNVPKAWIDGAAKEDEVIILGTWGNRGFETMTAPFRERYPKVKLNYHRTGTSGRGMRVLIALREGRVIGDVLTAIADSFMQFEKAKALADLRELPGFKNLAKDHVAADGTWAAHKISFRCLGYNTTKVKKSDLPATWDDLLTNPIWRNGNLAISSHASSWLLTLWGGKGEKWGEEFTRRLFTEVQPQQRKEGMTATTALTVAGEFYANLPSPEWRAKQYAEKGAPIGYHCPAPVPVTLSQIVMLEKAAHKNGARLFINWMLSREGQLLQYADSDTVPVHKALQSPRFVPFSDTVVGKPHLVRDDTLLSGELHRKMLKVWDAYWTTPLEKEPKKGKKKGKKKKE